MKWLIGIFCFLIVLAVFIFQPEYFGAAVVGMILGGPAIYCRFLEIKNGK